MAIARHQFPGAASARSSDRRQSSRAVSLPLVEAARVVDKVSQNLHAEILLRDVAFRLTGKGSREGGLDALTHFFSGAGIGPDDYQFSDGSGLSRYNIVTPHAIATLLNIWPTLRCANNGSHCCRSGESTVRCAFDSGRYRLQVRFTPKPVA